MKTFAAALLCAFQIISVTLGQQNIQCTSTLNSCSCQTADGIIDLSPLQGSNNLPAFQDVVDNIGGDAFSYNPCQDFTEGTGSCNGVAACQVRGLTTGQPEYYSLGAQNSATFVNDPTKGLELQYSDTDTSGVTRTAYVQLNCDQTREGALIVDAEDPSDPGNYYMSLTSKHACPKSGPPPDKTTTAAHGPTDPGHHTDVTVSVGLSTGGILCIVFFMMLTTYFVAGVLVQKFVRKQQGREMVPNAGFWVTIPGLIKDGFMFVVRRGKTGGYDSH